MLEALCALVLILLLFALWEWLVLLVVGLGLALASLLLLVAAGAAIVTVPGAIVAGLFALSALALVLILRDWREARRERRRLP